MQAAAALPSAATVEVALFKTGGDQWGENKGNYHNPKRQRAIFANTAATQKSNPSLTPRVVTGTNTQLQKRQLRRIPEARLCNDSSSMLNSADGYRRQRTATAARSADRSRQKRFSQLADDVPDGLAAMRDGQRPTGAIRQHRMRIDAQLLVDCGNDVGGGDGV